MNKNVTDINASDLGVINSLFALTLKIKIWSAQAKLTTNDFRNGADLPPEEIASLGNKRIGNPEKLKVFGMLKARAVSLLDKSGVRFLSGWAIPETSAEDVIFQLQEIKQDFDAAIEEFLATYDEDIQDWINQHPNWSSIIAGSVVDVDYVKDRLGFDWQLFKVTMPETDCGILSQGLQEEVEGLGRTLFEETAKAADETWEKCYAGKEKVSHKALSPLKTIHNKLVALSFVEPHVAPIADLINTALKSIPKRGHITGAPLVTLQGLVALLRDPAALIEHAKLVIGTGDPHSVLAILGKSTGTEPESHGNDDSDVKEAAPPAPARRPLVSCSLLESVASDKSSTPMGEVVQAQKETRKAPAIQNMGLF